MRSESWKVAPIFTDKGRARNLWKFKFSNVVVPFVGVNIIISSSPGNLEYLYKTGHVESCNGIENMSAKTTGKSSL